MSCAGARKGRSHRRDICKGLGGHKVVCNLNLPYSKLGQVPASQASTLVMGQHLQEEKKEEEEKKKEKVDLSDEEVRLALSSWPPEPEDVDPSQDAVQNAPEGMLNVWDLLTPFQQELALTHPRLLEILPVNSPE